MSVDLRRSPRLYVDAPLAAGAMVELLADQVHYLASVLRLGSGDSVRLFNGRDGEWLSAVAELSRKRGKLEARRQLRRQEGLPDIHYLFAPLKHARLDYMAQKATELGAARLAPVLTAHTVARRVNLDRLRANAVEAAEQCNLLAVPEVVEPQDLSDVLDTWDSSRRLIYCDEAAPLGNSLAALQGLAGPGGPVPPLAVLVGPEGGFSAQEQQRLRAHPDVTAISLGPRVMRADTAAIAALTLVQAACGDWR
ncbi:16S rRNA (uracil(1498)-N(3))-methyltransferase [Rhodoligotrophos defluvii]|uniref:16S rRNA (uracil(1498)-N(3))-methyltransferase n=1 Tax=Rhodoligotrophos defluvii TaxID=2561934 RepID=UPI0023B317B3|nr:16S rRNA (uracil(1498)-N(3))-methyltransferase [Rhodoligotrophos defluvii]